MKKKPLKGASLRARILRVFVRQCRWLDPYEIAIDPLMGGIDPGSLAIVQALDDLYERGWLIGCSDVGPYLAIHLLASPDDLAGRAHSWKGGVLPCHVRNPN